MFFEEENINEILNCNKCQEKLDDPKILPCGESVCSRCVSSIHVKKNNFECIVCNEQHVMPDKGLPTNKKLLSLISMQPAEVYRSRTVIKLKESLKEIRTKAKGLTFGAENGIDFIKEYCLDLMNDVQLATEKLIQQINDYNDEIIKEIKNFENSYIKSYKEVKQKTKDEFIKTAKELDKFELKWTEYLKQLKIDDETVSNAYNEALKLNKRANAEQYSLEKLILNGKRLKFEINATRPIKLIIGCLEVKEIDSEILPNSQYFQLMDLCSLSKEWELIYRASRDGFEANDFHLKCDKKPNTLVIIKSTNGNIFGGYTEQDWTSVAGHIYKNDPKAFIFSLVNKENKPLVMKPLNQGVIGCSSSCGPLFGRFDILIGPYSNQNNKSYSKLGSGFKHPDYSYGSDEAKSFLAGSFNFKTVEIEVFTKK